MKKKGFTLIELLVTIVLFSLLLVTALYSFRFISINIKNINNTNPQNAMNFDILRKAFNSTYYYIDNNPNKMNIDEKLFYYFKGEKTKCRFISKSSIFFAESTVIAQIRYKEKKLWYEESIIFDKSIDYKDLDNIKTDKRLLLMKNIDDFQILYDFNGQNYHELKNKIPQLVSIKFKNGKNEYKYLFHIKSNSTRRLEVIKAEHREHSQ
jgi:prepilin-type N-terminal cleavage/methylation domain-containing protein